MEQNSWSKSNADYGRKLFHAAVDGARSAQKAFLKGRPLAQYLEQSVQNAWIPAAFGLCVGLLAGYPATRRRACGKAAALGVAGGIIGFSAGVAWKNRQLAAKVASGAWENIETVRDEHWFETHPIDYA